ncbi:MAG: S1 RNA-binding domain-containing protein [Chloroflexi bacterium]|nr:S1 RNA-binding domain-containing protein [Chloroflexota bacterium]MCI0579377.1 S1 RNA-binding domain-containing protein [Chloroflexota bacterium]MCI0650207.1 S1 RNA-binding domain-containing protein [Chloroflexota bacterium]MCI0729482.1 S1 RNA-binding domain-containing protein [Chloroflexota bacterium]
MAEEVTDFTEDLAHLLEEHDYDMPEVGDIRTGVIVAISPQGIIIDLGLKRDGLVPPTDLQELSEEEREALKVNDEIPVYILETNEPDRLLVSIHRARVNQDWIRAEEMMASGEVFEAPVIGYNRGGIIVPFGNLRGFVPASHLVELRRGMDDRQRQQLMSKLRNQVIPLKVIEVDRRRRRLVMSQRDAQKEWQEARKEELIHQLKEGDVVKGKISGLRSFGAFVNLGGADGLIHISELAWHRVDHPREVVKVGDEIEVYVLGLDKEAQRIALSRKKLLPNPWDLAMQKYAVNDLVEGKITRIVDYGAFVEIEPGVEGLLHLSQLSAGSVQDPREVIKEGETHLLRIVSISRERQRIGLSLKNVTSQEQIEWMARRAETPAPQSKKPAAPVREKPAAAPAAGAVAEDATPTLEMPAEDIAQAETRLGTRALEAEIAALVAGADEEE